MSISKITLDKDRFDKCQIEMATAIIATIVTELRKAELPEDQFKEIATGIAFHVCCVLDASQVFDEDIFPVVTFQTDSTADDEVITCGGASYMHEYVHGLMKKWFPLKKKTGFDT